jgi:FAD/FMN-containing dehydrogenase
VEEGERAIKAIRDFGAPAAGEIGPMPYTALQSMLDDGFPSGMQVHWRSEFVKSISDELIEAVVSAYERVPSPLSAILFEQFGGAVRRVPRDATAYDQRDSDFNLVIVSRWTDAADAERNVQWARSLSDSVRAYTTGRVYVNYIGAGEAPDRVRAAFGPDKFAKLSAIKRKYDPTNLFRLNQNIPPD